MAYSAYGSTFSQPSQSQLRGQQMGNKGNVFGRNRYTQQAPQEPGLGPDMSQLEELFSKYFSQQQVPQAVPSYQPQTNFYSDYLEQQNNPDPAPVSESVAPAKKVKPVKPVKGLAPTNVPAVPKPVSAGTAEYRARRAPGGSKYVAPV